MVDADRLLEEFRSLSVSAGREIFLRVEDVVSLIDAADSAGVALLSFEGFEFDGSSLKSRLDYIAEFLSRPNDDWEAYQSETIAGARAFIALVPQDLVLIPQLRTREEWDARHGDAKKRQQGKA